MNHIPIQPQWRSHLILKFFYFFSIVLPSNNIEFIKIVPSKYNNKFLYIGLPTKMTHSGYEKDRFVNLSFDEFDCIICSEVAMDPLECEGCGKLFCKICMNDWMLKNPVVKCPNRCTASIGAIKSKALLRTYQNLLIRCINPKCNQPVKLGQLKTHQQICLKIKCWNFAVCCNPQNQGIKFEKPVCSNLCRTIFSLGLNINDPKKMYQILTQFLSSKGGSSYSPMLSSSGPSSSILSPVGSGMVESSIFWDSTNYGSGIVVSEGGTLAFLKQQAYVFRTIIANVGFSSGVHYWEIVADNRTENQIKIGVTGSRSFDLNSAFCDHPFGWAYYGLGQLRHGSNATGPAYGKRFKKQGVLGVLLNMNNGTLSFCLNGQNMGVAYTDQKLKAGTFYPAVSLLHCAGCRIRSASIPPCFNV